uniref:TPR_REGION domain-containing protein n=1 Tax=Macrostomum lignano TaxID=282301 RepID=A0A1I8GA02_9PLAT
MALSNTLLQNIKLLQTNEMYEDIKIVLGPIVTIAENNERLLSHSDRLTFYVHLGDACHRTGEHQKALRYLGQALQLRRCTSRLRGLPTEADIRWRSYLCYAAQRLHAEACRELACVPEKARTPAMHLALGQSYLRSGEEKLAQTAFKCCVKATGGLSMEAIKGLLACRTPLSEVLQLLANCGCLTQRAASATGPLEQLLARYFDASVQAAGRAFRPAIEALVALDGNDLMTGDSNLLATLGEAFYQCGDYTEAERILTRLHSLDSNWLRHIDSLAELLHRHANKTRQLECLAASLMQVSEHRPEPYVVYGYLNHSNKRSSKAMFFAQKALTISPNSVHALIVCGYVSIRNGKERDALSYFTEARKLAPNSFEVQHGIVWTYINRHKYRNAIAKAELLVKQLGRNPRTLGIYGLATSYENKDKAIEILADAFAMFNGRGCLPECVSVLAELYMEKKRYPEAKALLVQKIEQEPAGETTAELHRLLGDCHSRCGQQQEALVHYEIAIRLDSKNRKAHEGAVAMRSVLNLDSRTAGTHQHQMDHSDDCNE